MQAIQINHPLILKALTLDIKDAYHFLQHNVFNYYRYALTNTKFVMDFSVVLVVSMKAKQHVRQNIVTPQDVIGVKITPGAWITMKYAMESEIVVMEVKKIHKHAQKGLVIIWKK